MKGYIMAAGDGTRMRPLTANTSKALLPVAGKPFLEHSIQAMKENGIEEICILTGWGGREIRELLGDGGRMGVRLRYVEQEKRLGTAHAIGMVRDVMKEDFVALNGDILVSAKTIRGLIDAAVQSGKSAMTLTRVPNPSQFGVVEVENGMVKKIHEKPKVPPSDLVNAGAYYFKPEVFGAISKTGLSSRGEYELTDSLEMMAGAGGVATFVSSEEWIDVGRPWDLLRANHILMKGMVPKVEGDVEERATLKGPVSVGKGSVVRNGAYILGPVIIGEGCDIGPNCFIRPSTYVGDGCKVGNGCEVKNTIVMAGSHVPHLNYVGDSVIGHRCNLGAGTKVANLRLDGSNIKVTLKGERVDTGLRKLGVIMGDDVKTGINASFDVGSIIGEESYVGPGALVSGYIAPRSRVL
ncbi:MAG: bifunctional sugar-1-phosphate nucleotidylyltransferase/acetyltransferase [Methanobacteriota archaeon]